MSTITERVAKGAQFLDEHDPEWWRADVEDAINLDGLDLGSEDMCVLGQRCPLEIIDDDDADNDSPYLAYAHELSGIEEGEITTWATAHGFVFAPFDEFSEWDGLTAEWKRVITARRAAS